MTQTQQFHSLITIYCHANLTEYIQRSELVENVMSTLPDHKALQDIVSDFSAVHQSDKQPPPPV